MLPCNAVRIAYACPGSISPRHLGGGCESVTWGGHQAYDRRSAEVVPHGSQGSIPAAKRFKPEDRRPWSGTEAASPTAGRAAAGDMLWTPPSVLRCALFARLHFACAVKFTAGFLCGLLPALHFIVSSQLVALACMISAAFDTASACMPAPRQVLGQKQTRSGSCGAFWRRRGWRLGPPSRHCRRVAIIHPSYYLS